MIKGAHTYLARALTVMTVTHTTSHATALQGAKRAVEVDGAGPTTATEPIRYYYLDKRVKGEAVRLALVVVHGVFRNLAAAETQLPGAQHAERLATCDWSIARGVVARAETSFER